MQEEQILVEAAASGDRKAFEELVRRTSRLVYAKVYLQTGDFHGAEDLVQETYLRAFRSIRQVQDPCGFRNWLLTVAQSACVDVHRRNSRNKRLAPKRESQEVIDRTAAPQNTPPDREDERRKVRDALNSLPEEYRMPLTLRYIDGADYQSITIQLGMTNGSLRGLLYRGLKLLREALETEDSDE